MANYGMNNRVFFRSSALAGTVVVLTLLSSLWAAPPCQDLPVPNFSFDRNSVTVMDGTITPSSILVPAPGEVPPNVFINGANLGLGPMDELDALSSSNAGLGRTESFILLFSVDGTSQGSTNSEPSTVALGVPYNVAHQSERNQQAGDQFQSLRLFNREGVLPFLPRGPAPNNNTLSKNNWDEGGRDFNAQPPTSAGDANTRGILPQDNVDAIAIFSSQVPGTIGPIYFSIGAPGLPGVSPADVVVDFNPTGPGGENIFLLSFQMGLQPFDDIDGLIVIDENGNGIAEQGDQVLFSLAPGSPFLMNHDLSPADVLTYNHNPGVPGNVATLYASADLLGLDPTTDRLDALEFFPCTDGLDCAAKFGIRETQCAPAVSSWGVLLLALLVTATGAAMFRRSTTCQLEGQSD